MGFDMRSYPGGMAPSEDLVLRFEATFHSAFTEPILLLSVMEFDRRLVIPSGKGEPSVV